MPEPVCTPEPVRMPQIRQGPLRAAPPAQAAGKWGSDFCRLRAVERAAWPVGRVGTANSRAGFRGLG
eukprot:15444997-Alexandrium_andersonii.AAC.1